MKLVVLGFDCVSYDQFLSEDFEPLRDYIGGSNVHNLAKARKWSRGWADMITGEDANTHGGYYDFPKMSGSSSWSKSVNLDLISKKSKLFWDMEGIREHEGLIVNIPTTYPAPKINGAFISGAGGGAPVSREIASAAVSPRNLRQNICSEYIQDLRLLKLRQKGMPTVSDVEELIEMEVARLKVSERIIYQRPSLDYAFIVNRATAVMNYAFGGLVNNPNNVESRKLMGLFYRKINAALVDFLEKVGAENIVIVSDHGYERKEYEFNLNIVLRDKGFYRGQGSTIAKAVRALKGIVPYELKQRVKKGKIGTAYKAAPVVSKEAIAFSHSPLGTNFGVMINSDESFGGCVPREEVESEAELVLSKLSEDRSLAKKGFKFEGECKPSYIDVPVLPPVGWYQNDNLSCFSRSIPNDEVRAFKRIRDENVSAMKSERAIFSLPKSFEGDMSSLDIKGLPDVINKVLND